MSLVQAKCTFCGAVLLVDNAEDASICEHCGHAFCIEKAISLYQSGATTTNDYVIRAGVLEKYRGPSIDAVIPNNVFAIGNGAFRDCSQLRSVIIPETVESIGDEAFLRCKHLQSIIIPESVETIGTKAFMSCTDISTISIPDNVRSIGSQAFAECSSLTDVKLSHQLTFISTGCFSECTKLPAVTIHSGIIEIQKNAFLNCTSLAQISIPESLTKIGDEAFAGCPSIDTFDFTHILEIGNCAFYNSKNLSPAKGHKVKMKPGAFGAYWASTRHCPNCGGAMELSYKSKDFIDGKFKVVAHYECRNRHNCTKNDWDRILSATRFPTIG